MRRQRRFRLSKIAILALSISGSTAHAQSGSVNSHDLTVRGNIGWTSQENYRQSLMQCSPGKQEQAPSGQKLVLCLKQRVVEESAYLEAVYKGTVDYLRSEPAAIAALRQSEKAWLFFQSSNCKFDAATAPHGENEMHYLDCVLRSTIDRWTELRSLVGD
jgi:uncharacterized protein YecT (DUF1311 family)